METNSSSNSCSVSRTALHVSKHSKKCYPVYMLQDSAFGIEPLPWVQTAHFCRMILPWCSCKDSFFDKLLKVTLGMQQNHTVIPWCWARQWKQSLIWDSQCHSFANFLSKFLLHQIKLRYYSRLLSVFVQSSKCFRKMWTKHHWYFTEGNMEVEKRRSSPSQLGLALKSQTKATAHTELLLLDSLSNTFKSNIPQPISPCFPIEAFSRSISEETWWHEGLRAKGSSEKLAEFSTHARYPHLNLLSLKHCRTHGLP